MLIFSLGYFTDVACIDNKYYLLDLRSGIWKKTISTADPKKLISIDFQGQKSRVEMQSIRPWKSLAVMLKYKKLVLYDISHEPESPNGVQPTTVIYNEDEKGVDVSDFCFSPSISSVRNKSSTEALLLLESNMIIVKSIIRKEVPSESEDVNAPKKHEYSVEFASKLELNTIDSRVEVARRFKVTPDKKYVLVMMHTAKTRKASRILILGYFKDQLYHRAYFNLLNQPFNLGYSIGIIGNHQNHLLFCLIGRYMGKRVARHFCFNTIKSRVQELVHLRKVVNVGFTDKLYNVSDKELLTVDENGRLLSLIYLY